MELIDRERDPLTGLQTTSWLDNEGQLHVDYKQDATAAFEANLRKRNDPDHWKRGVKGGGVHAMHIPDGVVMELFKIGVNVYTCPLKDLLWGLKRINRLEACMLTTKRIG